MLDIETKHRCCTISSRPTALCDTLPLHLHASLACDTYIELVCTRRHPRHTWTTGRHQRHTWTSTTRTAFCWNSRIWRVWEKLVSTTSGLMYQYTCGIHLGLPWSCKIDFYRMRSSVLIMVYTVIYSHHRKLQNGPCFRSLFSVPVFGRVFGQWSY